jgi:hypothetical protein
VISQRANSGVLCGVEAQLASKKSEISVHGRTGLTRIRLQCAIYFCLHIEAVCRKTVQDGKPSFKVTSTSPLFELARVFVRFDHVARGIVNVDHSDIRQ